MRHPLPYAWAKAQRILLEDDGERLVLWADAAVDRSALAEVQRLYAIDALELEPPESLARRIAAAYAGGESSATAGIGAGAMTATR